MKNHTFYSTGSTSLSKANCPQVIDRDVIKIIVVVKTILDIMKVMIIQSKINNNCMLLRKINVHSLSHLLNIKMFAIDVT